MDSFQIFGSPDADLATFTKETLSNIMNYSGPLAIKAAATATNLTFGLKLLYTSLKDGLDDIIWRD